MFDFCSVLVEVKGGSLNQFLNMVSFYDIKIKRIYTKTLDKIVFSINSKEYAKLQQKFDNTHYDITLIKTTNIIRLRNFILSHIGCLIAILICVLFSVFVSQLCLGIKINCTDTELSDNIQEYFIQHNLLGTSKTDIDCDTLEYNLYKEFDDISLVSVSFRGAFLIVNTTTKTFAQDIKYDNEGNLVAKEDGIVTRIHLISGTPMVNVGDVVYKGDVLIANYYIDRNGEQVSCVADGVVYASKWYSATVDYAVNTIEYARTGNVCCSSKFQVFNQNISIKEVENTFQHYEVEQKINYLAERLYLPIKICYTYYYETEPIEIQRDFEQDKSVVIYEAREKTLLQCNESEILDEKYTISFVGEVYFVTYYMSINIEIT